MPDTDDAHPDLHDHEPPRQDQPATSSQADEPPDPQAGPQDGSRPRTPAEALLASLQRALADVLPPGFPAASGEPDALVRDAVDGLRPVLSGFLSEFELVPKREFEGYLASLQRLQQTLSDLERRIAELEQERHGAD